MNMTDDNAAQTLCNALEAVELLAAVEVEHLTERGKGGLFSLLRQVADALEHLEQNHKFERRAQP